MATESRISTTVRLTLNAGTSGDKLITKNVSVGNISESATADTLVKAAGAFATLLEYPVAAVKKYSVSVLTAE